jgi:hypothetical protein
MKLQSLAFTALLTGISLRAEIEPTKRKWELMSEEGCKKERAAMSPAEIAHEQRDRRLAL